MTSLRSGRHSQAGVSTVETAFLMPVVLVSLMLLFEIAHMMLVVIVGSLALDSALKDIRDTEGISLNDSEYLSASIVTNMRRNSFGYLNNVVLNPDVMIYKNLNMMSTEAGDEETDTQADNQGTMPLVVAVTVESQVPFVTSLPAMLLMSNQFGYRFHQISGTLYQKEDDDA